MDVPPFQSVAILFGGREMSMNEAYNALHAKCYHQSPLTRCHSDMQMPNIPIEKHAVVDTSPGKLFSLIFSLLYFLLKHCNHHISSLLTPTVKAIAYISRHPSSPHSFLPNPSLQHPVSLPTRSDTLFSHPLDRQPR